MPKAEITDITSRHQARQEAEILSLCAAFDELTRQHDALFAQDFAINDIDVQREPMVERLSELVATTMEEHQARARALSRYMGEMQLKDYAASSTWPERLIAAILRDLSAPQSDDDAA